MNGFESDDELGSRQPSRMRAVAGDPWLKVHAVAEYIFCPRAGILAHENHHDDDDEEQPSLYTLPKYELEAIERALIELRERCVKEVWIFVVLALCGPVGVLIKQYWALVFIGIGMVYYSQRILNLVADGTELLKRRNLALRGRCEEPDPDSDILQSINWFGLLNLGFESIRLHEPLRDPAWQLEGKPWRVLKKGSLVIPVFHTKSNLDRPRDQHTAKIMAYCRLVEVSFNVECPYGIILTREDCSGFSIPNMAKFRRGFHNEFIEFRNLARESDSIGSERPIAYNPDACEYCPLGEPHAVRSGKRVRRHGAPLPIVVLRDSRGKELRCDCGDRFEWKPPHVRNRYLEED